MGLRQFAIGGASRLEPLVGRDPREVLQRSAVAWEKRHADIVPARVEIFGEVAEGLRRVTAAMQQENRRRFGAAGELEGFGAGDDPVYADRKAPERLVAQPRSR